MAMYTGVTMQERFADTWRELGKSPDGTLSRRMTDDAAEDAFWAQHLKRYDGLTEIDPYLEPMRQQLLEWMDREDEVLEIGPGWGNYTYPVAGKVKSLTCLDISSNVLEFIQSGLKQQGITNTGCMQGKWEEARLERTYDVVFGVNCFYRMQEIEEALLRMNRHARKRAVVGLTSGPEKPHLVELSKLSGFDVQLGRRDYIHLVNILYQIGIHAEVTLVPLEKETVYENREQLLEDNMRKVRCSGEEQVAYAHELISKHAFERDGKMVYPHRYYGVFVHWQTGRNA
ncbi:class I SAM-dependent methyltransferase [Paenibacillus sambharensis]|nr:class I SAM-dependent methyltransferase [Paenibacillus sambharensis]